MMTIPRQRRVLLYLCVTFGLSSSLFAQAPTKPWTVETSVNLGGSFDFPGAGVGAGGYSEEYTYQSPYLTQVPSPALSHLSLGRKSGFVLGGEASISVTRFMWLYGDYGYIFPDRNQVSATVPVFLLVGSQVLSLGLGTTVSTASRQYWTGTGGLEVSLPKIHRIVPFARFGAGYVHQSYNFNSSGENIAVSTGVPGAPTTIVVPATTITRFENIPSVTFGGGVRWYTGERHGVRIMVDGFRLGHSVDDVVAAIGGGYTFVARRSGGRITVGYFIHFGH